MRCSTRTMIERRCGRIREFTDGTSVERPTTKYLRRTAAEVEKANTHLSTSVRFHATQCCCGGAIMPRYCAIDSCRHSYNLLTNTAGESITAESHLSVLLCWPGISFRRDTTTSDIKKKRVSRTSSTEGAGILWRE